MSLVNHSFEIPHTHRSNREIDAAMVPGWETTDADNLIEIWGPGNAWANHGHEVTAHDGEQFAELNSTEPATLFQAVATTPGQVIRWPLHHRARNAGIAGTHPAQDTMWVLAGAGPESLQVQVPTGVDGPDLTDGSDAWGAHSGTYVVPPGQRTTLLAFKAIATASGDFDKGNFLDDITIETLPCPVQVERPTPSGVEPPPTSGEALPSTGAPVAVWLGAAIGVALAGAIMCFSTTRRSAGRR